MIVELNGLPASGKSTIVQAMIDQGYKDKLITFKTMKDLFASKKNVFQSKKLQFLVDFLNPKNLKINVLITIYAFSYKPTRARMHWLIRTITLVAAQSQFKQKENPNTCLLLHEGIIQYLTSIPHEMKIKENFIFNQLIKVIQRQNQAVLFVNCAIGIPEVIERIRIRKQKGNRFDDLSENNLNEVLVIKSDNLTLTRAKLQTELIVLELDMKSKLEVNIQKIFEFIA